MLVGFRILVLGLTLSSAPAALFANNQGKQSFLSHVGGFCRGALHLLTFNFFKYVDPYAYENEPPPPLSTANIYLRIRTNVGGWRSVGEANTTYWPDVEQDFNHLGLHRKHPDPSSLRDYRKLGWASKTLHFPGLYHNGQRKEHPELEAFATRLGNAVRAQRLLYIDQPLAMIDKNSAGQDIRAEWLFLQASGISLDQFQNFVRKLDNPIQWRILFEKSARAKTARAISSAADPQRYAAALNEAMKVLASLPADLGNATLPAIWSAGYTAVVEKVLHTILWGMYYSQELTEEALSAAEVR